MARQKRGSKAADTAARHGRLRRSVSWANAAKVLLTAVLVFAISGVSVAAYAVWGMAKDVKTIDLGPEPDAEAIGAGVETLDGELTILLVGSDHVSEDSEVYDGRDEANLNDVNLLLHIPADHKSATIISFPRDTMLPIPSCTDPETGDVYDSMSEQQLNSAMSYGGVPCVAATISELTGIEIPYAAMVTFDGVINISNAIGGVTVCLAQPIEDGETGLNLPEGLVTLKGGEALQFLRTRYGVGDGSDVSRISNQQVFMSALLRQVRSSETLTNPLKVYSLAKAGFESLELSKSMASVQFLQALAGTVVDIDLDRVNFVQYPTYTHPYHPGRLAPDYEAGNELMRVVMSGEPFTVAGAGEAAIEATPTTPAPTPDASGETGGTGTEAPPTTVLPESVTGQKASDETCSAGRTQW